MYISMYTGLINTLIIFKILKNLLIKFNIFFWYNKKKKKKKKKKIFIYIIFLME